MRRHCCERSRGRRRLGAGGVLPLLTLLATGGASPPDAAATLPRLAGVVVGPASRAAIFGAGSGWTVSEEGDEIGPYTVRSINPGQVVLAGPGGTYVLTPTPGALAAQGQSRAEAPPLTPAQAGALETGTSAGGAAIRYDGCVKRGYLPDGSQAAEPQFARLVESMTALPDHGGASPQDMAVWMRFGLDTARRAAAAAPYSREACRQAAEDWRRAGVRYGFRRRGAE